MPSESMTDTRLAEICNAEQAASPGPWETAAMNAIPGSYLYGPRQPPEEVPAGLMKCQPPISLCFKDAAFVALARSAIPELLAEVDRLRAALKAETARCAAVVRATDPEGDYRTTPDGEEQFVGSVERTLESAAKRVESGATA